MAERVALPYNNLSPTDVIGIGKSPGFQERFFVLAA
jgi:hypothetical protein